MRHDNLRLGYREVEIRQTAEPVDDVDVGDQAASQSWQKPNQFPWQGIMVNTNYSKHEDFRNKSLKVGRQHLSYKAFRLRPFNFICSLGKPFPINSLPLSTEFERFRPVDPETIKGGTSGVDLPRHFRQGLRAVNVHAGDVLQGDDDAWPKGSSLGSRMLTRSSYSKKIHQKNGTSKNRSQNQEKYMVEVMAPRNKTHKKPILLRWVNYVDASFKIHNGSSEEYLGTLSMNAWRILGCERL